MEKIEFSLAEGGALVNQLRKLGLLGENQPSMAFRVGLAVSMTWFPLLILTASQGLAFGKKVQVPFLLDLIQHARFLVALPIAIRAERYISTRFEKVLNRFIENEIISGEEVPRYKKAISRAKSLKDSAVVEIVIFVLIYLYPLLGLERNLSPGLSTWNHLGSALAVPNTAAERWFVWVSMPIFLFVWFRWVWRQCVWAFLLLRISRLRLRLHSPHPDLAGGLGFVSVGHRRYAALVFAISSIACASIGEEMLFAGTSLRTYELELAAFFVVCVLVVMGPLIVFSPPMIRAKLRDWGTYGALSARYVHGFDDKWIQGRNPSHEKLLGTPDIQSLSDLRNSFEGVSKMRTVLPDPQTIFILLLAYLLPASPLLATVIPLRQITSELFKLFLK